MAKNKAANTKEVVQNITAYSLDELITKVVELAKQGFDLDSSKPNGQLRNFVSMYELSMFRVELDEAKGEKKNEEST